MEDYKVRLRFSNTNISLFGKSLAIKMCFNSK